MRAERKGFTLIELLVTVVLGILAAIAIAKFVSTKESAYMASMKTDLRNFAIYEQNYEIESQGSYFAGNGVAQGFVPTVGVTINAVAFPGLPPAGTPSPLTTKPPKRARLSRPVHTFGKSTVRKIVRQPGRWPRQPFCSQISLSFSPGCQWNLG